MQNTSASSSSASLNALRYQAKSVTAGTTVGIAISGDKLGNKNVYLSEISRRNDTLKKEFRDFDFYHPARLFLGKMYSFYIKENFEDNDVDDLDYFFYVHAPMRFSIEWQYLFNKFREYERLIGMKKSAIGHTPLGFWKYNVVGKMTYFLSFREKKNIQKREEVKFKRYSEFLSNNFQLIITNSGLYPVAVLQTNNPDHTDKTIQ